MKLLLLACSQTLIIMSESWLTIQQVCKIFFEILFDLSSCKLSLKSTKRKHLTNIFIILFQRNGRQKVLDIFKQTFSQVLALRVRGSLREPLRCAPRSSRRLCRWSASTRPPSRWPGGTWPPRSRRSPWPATRSGTGSQTRTCPRPMRPMSTLDRGTSNSKPPSLICHQARLTSSECWPSHRVVRVKCHPQPGNSKWEILKSLPPSPQPFINYQSSLLYSYLCYCPRYYNDSRYWKWYSKWAE